MNEDVSIRKMEPEDELFVYDSWLRHYKECSFFGRRIPNSIFYEMHRRIIERILARKCTAKVAHYKDDKDLIIGYMVMEGTNESPVVHFIYVKAAFRKMGIAKTLLSGLNMKNLVFTHWTYDLDDWAKYKMTSASYDPYRL